jgi:hypothetical protein
MNARDAVKSTYALPEMLCRGYLDGLTERTCSSAPCRRPITLPGSSAT